MDRNQIIRRVRMKLDELAPFDGPEVVANPTIEGCLNEASDTLLLAAPPHIHPAPYSFSGNTVTPIDTTTGMIDLPGDYLLLVSFKLNEWRRAVVKPVVEGSNTHSRQHNPYARGGKWKPVLVYRFDQSRAKHVLQFYSSSDSMFTIDHALCINRTLPEYLPAIYIEPLTLVAGAMVLDIMGDERTNILIAELDRWIKMRTI